jgi:integrase/recombinase XerD
MELIQSIQDYLNYCVYEKQLSSKIIDAYKNDLGQFIDYASINELRTVKQLDKNELRAYIRVVIDKYKPKTSKRKLASLKAFFNWLEYEEIITVTPFRKIKIKIKEGNRLPRIIQKEHLASLFNHLNNMSPNFVNIRNRAIIEMLFATGMRIGEICSLTTDNLNLSEGYVRIIGKGDKERLIPLCNDTCNEAITQYISMRDISFSQDYILLTRTGNKMQEQNIRLILHKLGENLCLSPITPHMFRHSFATYLLEEGVDIRYIQALLGHSNITTTQGYTTVNEKKQRELLTQYHPRNLIST